MKAHIQTIDVNIDLQQLLKTVYAESAWRLAMHMTQGNQSPLIDADREALATQYTSQAFAHAIGWLSAYVRSHNLSAFASEQMLRLTLCYPCRRAAPPVPPATTLADDITGAIAAHVLAMLYPADEQYTLRHQQHRRAVLARLAMCEQA